MTSLRTNVEVLRDAPGMGEDDRRALLDDVVEQAEELGNLVGDLIALARDGEAPPATEDVRLDELVAEAVVRARRHAPAVSFTLRAEPCLVSAAPDRIGRAVNNLLDNAAQHADRVEVTVSADGVVAVRDHGPGVPPEDVPLVFDRFYRGATARGRSGSGLGLAIVRQVAESHGGSVRVESPEDGGARFVLVAAGRPGLAARAARRWGELGLSPSTGGMTDVRPPRELAMLQDGVVARWQLIRAGLSERSAECWVRGMQPLGDGVFLPGWHRPRSASSGGPRCSASPGTVLSHASAAACFGLRPVVGPS